MFSPKVEANKVHRLLDRIIPSVLSHGAETWPGNELKLISRNRGGEEKGASINFEGALASTRRALEIQPRCTMQQWPQTGDY